MELNSLHDFRKVPPFPLGARPQHIERIYITDTTLRDGQQGWRYLSKEESAAIYELLHEIGGKGAIRCTEVFLYTPKDREVAKELRSYGYERPKVIAWVRATLSDVQLVADNGLDEAIVLMSISDLHIRHKFGLSREQAAEKYLEVARRAAQLGISFRASLEDITRADIEGFVIPFLERLMRISEGYGIEIGVRLPDTLGLGLPFDFVPPPRGIPALVKHIREATGLPPEAVEFHGHNDFGLVVANHLAAWLSGAGLSNCTLLGIGERSGNCPLEVMAIHYAALKGTSDINLKAMSRIPRLFEDMGYRVPEHQPLVGRNAFVTKAGIHADGLLKNPEVYLPFDPLEVLGIPYGVEITPYSGRAAIVLWLRNKAGMAHVRKEDPIVAKIHEKVVKLFDETGRTEPLDDEEMWSLVREALGEARGNG